jgi:hypothetical protein
MTNEEKIALMNDKEKLNAVLSILEWFAGNLAYVVNMEKDFYEQLKDEKLKNKFSIMRNLVWTADIGCIAEVCGLLKEFKDDHKELFEYAEKNNEAILKYANKLKEERKLQN